MLICIYVQHIDLCFSLAERRRGKKKERERKHKERNNTFKHCLVYRHKVETTKEFFWAQFETRNPSGIVNVPCDCVCIIKVGFQISFLKHSVSLCKHH